MNRNNLFLLPGVEFILQVFLLVQEPRHAEETLCVTPGHLHQSLPCLVYLCLNVTRELLKNMSFKKIRVKQGSGTDGSHLSKRAYTHKLTRTQTQTHTGSAYIPLFDFLGVCSFSEEFLLLELLQRPASRQGHQSLQIHQPPKLRHHQLAALLLQHCSSTHTDTHQHTDQYLRTSHSDPTTSRRGLLCNLSVEKLSLTKMWICFHLLHLMRHLTFTR